MDWRTFSTPDLMEHYGMIKFAELRISGDLDCTVTITDDQIGDTAQGVYIWLIDGQIVRIGSSKDRLRKRICGAGRWLELRLKDTVKTKSAARRQKELADAMRWKNLLCETGKHAEVWARRGAILKTPIGEINAYLSEENALLQRHKPPLNNSHFR